MVPLADLPAAEPVSTTSRSALQQPSVHDYRRTKPIADLPAEAVVHVYDNNSYGPIASADMLAGVSGEITILAIMDLFPYKPQSDGNNNLRTTKNPFKRLDRPTILTSSTLIHSHMDANSNNWLVLSSNIKQFMPI